MKIYIYMDSGFWNIARHDFVYMSAMNIFFFQFYLKKVYWTTLMQRMSRRNQLPVLRAPYDTQDEPFQPRPSPRNNEQETRVLPYTGNNTERQSRGPSRLDLLEERLTQQERNSQNLVDRAFKIKEDVIDSLNFTHGTWQEEKHARNMLQEHIRTITAVVNRLNSDISVSRLTCLIISSLLCSVGPHISEITIVQSFYSPTAIRGKYSHSGQCFHGNQQCCEESGGASCSISHGPPRTNREVRHIYSSSVHRAQ